MSQEDSISFSRVTIVGPGLLGGSIGMALREKGITGEIWAYLRDEKKRQTCTNLSWCDRAVLNLQEAVQESELVVLYAGGNDSRSLAYAFWMGEDRLSNY